MNPSHDSLDIQKTYEEYVISKKEGNNYRLTPFIVTFCDDNLTLNDIQTFIKMGLRIVRFRMTHMAMKEKIEILKIIKDALVLSTEWPISISVDIPNACVKTGMLSDAVLESEIEIEENWIVEVTSSSKYWNKCNSGRIYIDDSYILKDVVLGTEINIGFGEIVMICINLVDSSTILCKVTKGGYFTDMEFVCFRGVKHMKPALSKIDLQAIQFAKDFQLDILTLNSIRNPQTLLKIRSMFNENNSPLVVSTICEQEGLDNIDKIIELSDGIVLAREFLACEILDKNRMLAIQLHIGAKCRKAGKPFYVSGNILESTFKADALTGVDITDITNVVLQGAGLMLRHFKEPSYVIRAMEILDDICKSVETLSPPHDFWRLSEEFKPPVNAAEATILACAILAKQTNSVAIIVPTVSGRTAIQLSHILPGAVILSISSSPYVARQLSLYRGIVSLVYDQPTQKNWFQEMQARVAFAVTYALNYEILRYGCAYCALRKACPTSAFADSLSAWKVSSDIHGALGIPTSKSKRVSCSTAVQRNSTKNKH